MSGTYRLRSRFGGELTVVGLGLVLTVLNVWWVHRYRSIGSLEPDETGYLATALSYHRNLLDSPWALLQRVSSTVSGPLAPLVSIPFLMLFGRDVWVAQSIQTLLHVVVAVAVTATVRRRTSVAVGLVCGLVALTLPTLIMLDRSYQLATAAAAGLTVALCALLGSRRGDRTLYMACFGLGVAAMVMGRTMTIGFLPALGLASIINTRWDSRSVRNLFLAWSIFVSTAGAWVFVGWHGIIGYLFRSGYSEFSEYWGPGGLWARVTQRIGRLFLALGVPYSYLCIVAICVGSVVIIASGIRIESEDKRDLVVLTTVIVGGYAALLSTSNTGTFFDVPLAFVLLMIIGRLIGIMTLSSAGPGKVIGARVGVGLGAIAVLIAIATVVASIWPPAGRSYDFEWGMTWKGLSIDTDLITSGNFDADERLASSNHGTRRRAADEWEQANLAIVEAMHSYWTADPTLTQSVSGSAHLVNVNTLLMASELHLLYVGSIEVPVTFAADQELRRLLEPFDDGSPRVLVRLRPKSLKFPDDRYPARLNRLADELGWRIRREIPLPDGGRVEILTHPRSDPLG